MKYFVPVLYRMAAKVKKSAGPSTIIEKVAGSRLKNHITDKVCYT